MSDHADFMLFPDHGAKPGEALMNLTAIIGRIEEAVETETHSIRTDVRFDIRASNARKSRYLYELNKAIAGLGGASVPQDHRGSIVRLREKLAANERAILAHLNAVGEVAALMQDAIQRSEADGTYSANEFGRGAAPA
jgi:putative heme degradation protein